MPELSGGVGRMRVLFDEIDDVEAVAACDQRFDDRVAGEFGAAAEHRFDAEAPWETKSSR